MKLFDFVLRVLEKVVQDLAPIAISTVTESAKSYLLSVSQINDTPTWRGSKYVIQKHEAKRAGLHYDFRFEHEGKLLSWASRRLPSKGDRVGMFRQPDHSLDYYDFEGTIESGYGAGKVTIHEKGPCLYRIKDSNIDLYLYPEGKPGFKTWKLLQGNESWMGIEYEHPVPEYYSERKSYKLARIDEDVYNKDWFVTEKYDGSHYLLVIDKNGKASMISRRLSVNNDTVHREQQLIHITSQEFPKKYRNSVIRGEVYHELGASYTSGILLSKPPRAIETQRENGWLQFIPFDVERANGKECKLNIAEKRAWLDELCTLEFVHQPDIIESIEQLQDIMNRGGEGAVAVSLTSDKILKIKKEDTFDCQVIDITEATGKYKGNAIGALIVKEIKSGATTNVGSGFSDAERRWLYNNKEKVIGQVAEITAMEQTRDGALRAPRFKKFHSDSEVSLHLLVDGIGAEDKLSMLYSIKSAAGWRK